MLWTRGHVLFLRSIDMHGCYWFITVGPLYQFLKKGPLKKSPCCPKADSSVSRTIPFTFPSPCFACHATFNISYWSVTPTFWNPTLVLVSVSTRFVYIMFQIPPNPKKICFTLSFHNNSTIKDKVMVFEYGVDQTTSSSSLLPDSRLTHTLSTVTYPKKKEIKPKRNRRFDYITK